MLIVVDWHDHCFQAYIYILKRRKKDYILAKKNAWDKIT